MCLSFICSLRHQDEVKYSTRLEPDERGRGRERGRDRREKCRDSESGRSSRRQSAASLHAHVRWRQFHDCTYAVTQQNLKCLFYLLIDWLIFEHRALITRVEGTYPQNWRSELLLNARRHRWAPSHDFLHLCCISHMSVWRKMGHSYIHSKADLYFSFFTPGTLLIDTPCS